MLGKKHAEETKQKIGFANTGRYPSEETRKKLSLVHKGKPLSEEHRKKIGEANRKRILSFNTRLKISNALKGKRLGSKHSPATIERMREKRKLQIFSKETKIKMSESAKKRKGEFNSNWQGGITPVGLRIRNCIRYLQWRQQVFIRDNFTCRKCGDNKGGNLQAHHKKSFSILLKEMRQNLPLMDMFSAAMIYTPLWDIDNGLTLCDKCHKGGKI